MNYYYKLTNDKRWEKITIDSKESIVGNIVLSPEDFQPGDMVEVTAIPPISKENIRPLQDLLDELAKEPVAKFKPSVRYNSIGSMIEVLWKNTSYYVDYEKDNKHLAYCREFQTNEIVGVVIENVAKLKLC